MYPSTLSARTLRRLDAMLVVWSAVWITIAAYTAYEVQALGAIGDTVEKTGAAVTTVGRALEALAGIPILGTELRPFAHQVLAAGQSAQASGAATGSSVNTLSVLLGIAIGLIPITPVAALYVPLRVDWRRERQAVLAALARFDGDPSLELYLARRALANLPYHELHELGEDPWLGLDPAARRRLADAELRRLGITRPLPPPCPPPPGQGPAPSRSSEEW